MALLETFAGQFKKARAVNANDSSFPSRVPTPTEPPSVPATAASDQQAIDLAPSGHGQAGGAAMNSALIVPYGLGANNDAFSMRVIGWRVARGDAQNATAASRTKDLWVPVVLCEVACTISAAVGVAGAAVLATEAFADTITIVTGNSGVSVEAVSPTGDVIGHVLVDVKGFQKLELTFDQTTNTPTCNALVALI